jgi:hypothetical protein
LIGFVALLLAFLSVSFLEDGSRAAQVYWKKYQTSTVLFWIGAACGVFALSGLAFWLKPRGETNLGAPQVAILPFSANSLDKAAAAPDVNLATIPVALGRGEAESALPLGPSSPLSGSGNDDVVGGLGHGDDASGQMPGSIFLGNINRAGKDSDVVFFYAEQSSQLLAGTGAGHLRWSALARLQRLSRPSPLPVQSPGLA